MAKKRLQKKDITIIFISKKLGLQSAEASKELEKKGIKFIVCSQETENLKRLNLTTENPVKWNDL